MLSFPYFPLYTLDYIQGTVLFPGGYQLATLNSNVDLRAQTSGTTGVTYSWNTSNLTGATSISGASYLRPDLRLADEQPDLLSRFSHADGHEWQQPAGGSDLLLRHPGGLRGF